MVFLKDAPTTSLMHLVTGTSHLIPQTTKIICKAMKEDIANLSQESLSLTPLTITLPHILGSLFWGVCIFLHSSLRGKRRHYFLKRLTASLRAIVWKHCVHQQFYYLHIWWLHKGYMVSGFLIINLSGNMEPKFCPWQITKPPQKSMKL